MPKRWCSDLDLRRGQVARQLADHILVARFLEIGLHDRLGVGVGFLGSQPHAFCGPFTEQPVAPRRDAELQLLIAGKLGLKGAFTIVESAHNVLMGLKQSLCR